MIRRWFFTDPEVAIDSDDPALIAAVQKVVACLPEFWKRFERKATEDKDFAVKVRIEVDDNNDNAEQVWCEVQDRQGSTVRGILMNRPSHIPFAEGQGLEFDESDITDWAFRENGKLVGGETLRVMLEKVSPAEAKKMREDMGW